MRDVKYYELLLALMQKYAKNANGLLLVENTAYACQVLRIVTCSYAKIRKKCKWSIVSGKYCICMYLKPAIINGIIFAFIFLTYFSILWSFDQAPFIMYTERKGGGSEDCYNSAQLQL